MTLRLLGPLTLVLGVLAPMAGPVAARADRPWRYVVPAPGEPHESPPLRVIPLSPEKPEGLKETARYRGRGRRYAQICYGSPDSARVALVLDEVSADEADLYLDTARRRVIGSEDRVAGKGGTWRVALDALAGDGRGGSARRTVVFRFGRVGRTLSLATCGYLEGEVRLGGRSVAVRRVDGDGNGLFADPQDRLWIDLRGDGRWDPLEDQFLFRPVLSLGPARYAVSSDGLGRRLAFRKLEGTGAVRVALRPPALSERVEELTVTLMGRDGSVFSLRGRDARATLPVGDYRLSVLTLTLKDPRGGPPWSFVFSDRGGRPHRWHKLDKGGRLVLDPVGKLELLAVLDREDRRCRPGQVLAVRPQLYTGDGLLIATADRGSTDPAGRPGGCAAAVVLTSAEGTPLSTGASGFL
jgi:hypothetical protein